LNPAGTPIFDASGNLYGTTYQGGDGFGTAYEISASGAFSTITSFATDEGSPTAGLYLEGGQFYGTTAGNALQSAGGTVYEVGSSTPLYSFTGGADGAQPMGAVIGDGAGNLYGTTSGGGNGSFGDGNGVVFKLNTSTGAYTVLHTFSGSPDGSVPIAGLFYWNGDLYGTTVYGGAYGYGTVFELDPSAAPPTYNFTTLYSFTGGADGANPYAGVYVDDSGNIYGAASAGGSLTGDGTRVGASIYGVHGATAAGYGTVFVISPAAPKVRAREAATK
jgi:uncharacterized repeat protein (TIGR03803 family)